jgi:hypothetical protein
MFVSKAGAYLRGATQVHLSCASALVVDITIGWKGLPGTKTLAYSYVTKRGRFCECGPTDVVFDFRNFKTLKENRLRMKISK